MNKIYQIEPLLQSFIWGGRKIIDRYHIKTELPNVGIMYQVIAIPGNLDCRVKGTGRTLSEFYQTHRELFGCKSPLFPVRMALSCGEKRMSYHLHPDDAYALAHEGTRGKVTGAVAMEESGQVREKLFGNKAKSLEEIKALVAGKDWDHLFQTIKQKQGDFLHTPAGVIHGGGGEGFMSMTFSTNSDITYRFYDYERGDSNRPLHLQQVYDCVNIPEAALETIRPKAEELRGVQIFNFYHQPGEYTAQKLEIKGRGVYERREFYFLFCSDGEGWIGEERIREGETVFIPAGFGELPLEGNMRLYLISYQDAC